MKIDYTLRRSKRKTVAIRITKAAAVEVLAPFETPIAQIDQLVQSKSDWIEKHRAAISETAEQKEGFILDYNSKLLLRGQEYPIVTKEGERAGFNGQHFYMPPNLPPAQLKSNIILVYKGIAKKVLPAKTAEFAARMGLCPSAVKINSAKRRWGSCSGHNSINYSWRLVMADDATINYVVVHELAHTKEHNHSDKFWALVAAIFPNYKQSQQSLAQLQKRLECEDW